MCLSLSLIYKVNKTKYQLKIIITLRSRIFYTVNHFIIQQSKLCAVAVSCPMRFIRGVIIAN